MAITNSSIDAIKLLLGAGADIDEVNENGLSALMIASGIGNLTVVQLLLSYHTNTELGGDIPVEEREPVNVNHQSTVCHLPSISV
jgi:ankyrin repeat protein